MSENTLSPDLLRRMDAYWRAANYLSVGQIYLQDNPLLKEPLALSHVKPMLLGHWGTTPGQNFIYTHLNRVIGKYDLDSRMKIAFYPAMLGWSLLSVWIATIRYRIRLIEYKRNSID